MKVLSIAAAGVSLALIALTLAPAAGEYRAALAIAAIVCSAVALVAIAVGWRDPAAVASRAASAVMVTPPAGVTSSPPPVKAAPSPLPVPTGEGDVIGFLATLQEKGRLVDFLQDDITGYSDAQVGAAARVVHQGCRAVLDAYFRIAPVREESEGAKIAVPAGYSADEYRLVGKISGQAPFSGTLMHRGWKTESVTLPRALRATDDRLPTIAPAEVELR